MSRTTAQGTPQPRVDKGFPDLAGGVIGGMHDAVPVLTDQAPVADLGVHDVRVDGEVDLVAGLAGAGADPQEMAQADVVLVPVPHVDALRSRAGGGAAAAGGAHHIGLGWQGAPAQCHRVLAGMLGTQLGQGVGQDQGRLAAGGRQGGQGDFGDGL